MSLTSTFTENLQSDSSDKGGLRILWLTWKDLGHPQAGGAEVLTYEVTKRLAAAGNEVTVFTSAYEGCNAHEIVDGVQIVRSGTYRSSVFSAARQYYNDDLGEHGFDVIVDGINTRPFNASRFARNGERIVALISQLAKEYWFYETPFPLSYIGYYFLENRWLRGYVDVPTITVSQSTRKELLELGFSKVGVIPLGLNFEPLENLGEKESYPVIAYAGRINRAKRPDLLVKAFRNVRDRLPNSELWIIGEGPFKEKLREIAGDGVKFFDAASNSERRALLRRAWVLVNPSVREGFGLNIIEANALGVPCVAYDVPGLRDSIRDNETGMLVRASGPDPLSETLLRFLTEDSLRVKLSEGALRYSREFSWDRTAKEFMKLLDEFDGHSGSVMPSN
jgi:glycosyltransferase involved in cell wall biosynthesis